MNKSKKLIYTFLLLLISFMSYSMFFGSTKEIEKEIIQGLKEEFPNENFYFIFGLDKERSIATNIKYRGIIYSDKLAEMNYPQGLEIALENSLVPEATKYNIGRGYESMFWQIEIDNIVEKKAIEIFGNKCNLTNTGMTTPHMYKNITGNFGVDLTNEQKSGYQNTIVNVFVDDLEEMDIEEYKQKTYELSKYIYEYMNYLTSLQIYVRDNSYFENYELIKYSIFKPFREREDIKKILDKIEKNQKISEDEKKILVRSFRKGGLDYNLRYHKFKIDSSIIKKWEELKIEKVHEYSMTEKEIKKL